MRKIQLEEIFETIDTKNVSGFVSHLAEGAVFRYGSQEPVHGREAIRKYVAAFLGNLEGLQHRVLDTWEGDDSLVCQGEVTYVKKDGREVTIPFTNIFRLVNDQIGDYLVYADPTPLGG